MPPLIFLLSFLFVITPYMKHEIITKSVEISGLYYERPSGRFEEASECPPVFGEVSERFSRQQQ
jgi:hypothetical protein